MLKSKTSITKQYSYNQLKNTIKKLTVKKFSVEDLIMIILYAQKHPIYGKTMFMKQAFLLYKEHMRESAQDPKFVPYKFGPYSFLIETTLKDLVFQNIVKKSGKPNSSVFSLSHKGQKLARRVYLSNNKQFRDTISEKRKGWDQLGSEGILNYVYTNYGEYKINSLIKDRFDEIVWGERS